MKSEDIARLRLRTQGIDAPKARSALEVVSSLGALQAQDYPGALWSIGLRIAGSAQAAIEDAIDKRQIVRTWAMRGTLHFVPPADVRWMLDLFAPRLISGMAARRRNLELDEATITQATAIITAELQQHSVRTRDELCKLLDSHGISSAGQRGIHILRHLSLQKVLCFGPHQGKQPTFVLLDAWVPQYNSPTEEQALGLLAKRYFTSHGPASLQDFAAWSGLAMGRAKAGLRQAAGNLQEVTTEDGTYYFGAQSEHDTNNQQGFLLPGFDEFMLGYRNRGAALPAAYANRICPGGNGMFIPTLVLDGQVIGTWKKQARARSILVHPEPFTTLSADQRAAFTTAASRYSTFMQKPVELQW